MDRETFEQLKAATAGHTPGRWFLRERTADGELAAAAPALLAEVERLRGWMAHIEKNAGHWTNPLQAMETCEDALNGEEVPK